MICAKLKAFRRASWAPLVASFLWACGSAGSSDGSTAEQPRATSAPIIGGYLDSATRGVVALAFKVHNQVAVFCSGSLLAPNLVLTARHCIAQIGDGSSEQVDCDSTRFTGQYDPKQIFVSTDAQPQTSGGTLFAVNQIRQAPGSSSVCGYDVALLILNSNVPSSAATPIVPALGLTTAADEGFSAVGYGLQDPKDSKGATAGNRMRFDGSGVYCVGTKCPPAAGTEADEFVGNSPVCSGDSGGPALDAAGRVFGVTSRGDTDCTYALYSNVANWADFIRTAGKDAAKAGGYLPASWVNDTGGGAVIPTGGASGGTSAASGGASTGGGTSTGGSAGDPSSSGGESETPTNDTPPPVQSVTPTVSALGDSCDSDHDCPGAYRCYSSRAKPPGICVPPCGQNGAGCPTDYTCSDSLGVCTPQTETVVKGHVSASCALSTSNDHENGAVVAALLVGCAWFGRRRRNAS